MEVLLVRADKGEVPCTYSDVLFSVKNMYRHGNEIVHTTIKIVGYV